VGRPEGLHYEGEGLHYEGEGLHYEVKACTTRVKACTTRVKACTTSGLKTAVFVVFIVLSFRLVSLITSKKESI
jgi:hypothetical protein